jgi:hypothetical protein
MQVVSGPIVVIAHNLQAALIQALVYFGPGLVDGLVSAAKGARRCCQGLFRRIREACACAGMRSRESLGCRCARLAGCARKACACFGSRRTTLRRDPHADSMFIFPTPTAPPASSSPPSSNGEDSEQHIVLGVA